MSEDISVCRHCSLKAENKKLQKALEFYANPETYFAIMFLPDKPCGDFVTDFSNTELGVKPGKRARKILELDDVLSKKVKNSI